tara:strand:- start:2670 stop:10034 length:7365 start_codon:yes stop_codon:yes gene_type:complete
MAKVKNINDRTSLESFAQDEKLFAGTGTGTGTGRGRGMLPAVTVPPVGRTVSGATGNLDLLSQVEPFRFLECEPISINGGEPKECPVCTPNPYAYVPDYTTMAPGEPYFDGKTCTQCYVMEVAPPNLGGTSVSDLKNPTEKQADIKRIGIRNLLEYYGKSDVAVVYYYEQEGNKEDAVAETATVLSAAAVGGTLGLAGGPVGTIIGATLGALAAALGAVVLPDPVPGYVLRAEERDVVEELLGYTDIKYTVPIQLKGRTKIAVCVSSEAWERIPTKLVTEPDTPFETTFEVNFTGEDFDGMFKHAAGDSPLGLHFWAGGLRLYAKQLEKWRDLEGGMLEMVEDGVPVLLDLNREADKLIDFHDNVAGIIKEAAGLDMKDLEKINFKFEPTEDSVDSENPKIRLKQMIFNKKGCPEIIFSEEDELGRGYFRTLTGKSPFKLSRSLYYVGSLPDMDADLQAGEPVPWLEFVLKYTYPALQIRYDQNNEDLFNDPDLGACLADSLLDEEGVIGAALDALGKELLGLPDAILGELSENMCLTKDQLKKKKALLREDYDKELSKTLDESKKEFSKGDPYLDHVFQYIENVTRVRKDPKDQVNGVWESLMSRLGYCGWISLIMKALDCAIQGMDEESFKKAVVDAALSKMADPVLQGLMAGLSQEDKNRIQGLAGAKFANLPAPWDTMAYEIGSYNSPGMTANETYDAIAEVPDVVGMDLEDDELASTEEEMGSLAFQKATAAAKAQIDANKSAYDQASDIADLEENIALTEESINDVEYTEEEVAILKESLRALEQQLYDAKYPQNDMPPDISGGLFGVAYSTETGDFSFGTYEQGGGGTYGEALGAVQKELFDAYRNVIMDAVDIDVLFNALGNIPGAAVIGQFIKTLPCKKPPTWSFDPKLDSFMNTIEFDFCHIAGDKTFDITWPSMTKGLGSAKAGSWNILLMMAKAVKKAIINAAIAVVMAAIKALLNWLMNLACNLLKMLGAGLGDLYNGNDHFKDMLLDNLCPGASDDQLADALKNLMNAVGGPESDCLKDLTNGEMGDFIDDLSLMLTQEQIIQLLDCNPTEETLALATEVARISPHECIRELFSDPASIKDLFCSLGIFVPTEALGSYIPDMPVSPCPPEVFAAIEDIKCGLLSKKGLSEEECREELDKAKEKSIQDLQDLINLMQNGPMSDFPGINSTGDCPNDGFYPSGPDPIEGQVNSSVTAMLLTPIEKGVMKDLMGSAGVLNNILADTNGAKWTWHDWKVRLFGTPLASQQGFLDFTCDDAIKSLSGEEGDMSVGLGGIKYTPKPVNVFGEEVDPGNFLDISSGGFPPTVGAWMARTFRSLNPEFKTETNPENYYSLSQATADVEKKEAINAERIEARQKYVSAFIKEHRVDGVNATKDSANLAGMLRSACYSARVLETGTRRSWEEVEDNEVPESVYWLELLLTGAEIDCCGLEFLGIGHSAKYSSKQVNPYSWSDSSQELADTEGRVFVDHHPPDDFKLIDVPDIITPDMQLIYSGHDLNNDGEPLYSFQMQYDYNIADQGGSITRDNNYKIKIIETNRQPPDEDNDAGQNALQISGDFTYPSYNFVVEAELDNEVKQYINTLPVSPIVRDSWQIEVFYRLISQQLLDVADNDGTKKALDDPSFREYFSSTTTGAKKLDNITSGFFKRLANRIATGRSFSNPAVDIETSSPADILAPDVPSDAGDTSTGDPILDNIAPAFRYGYDPKKGPQIIFLDNETYGGPLGRMFPDLVPPPFYVKSPEYGGWKEITDMLVPTPNGCDPSRGPLFALGDLGDMVSKLEPSLKQDERFSYDPLCTQEAPYDKIFDNSTAANIDAVLRAATRAYITEAFMRVIPIVSQFEFNDENVESGIVEFIVERIKRGLKADGISYFLFPSWNNDSNDDDYYYRFMEQTVNTVIRKVDAGILDPDKDFNSEEKQAYDIITAKIIEFYDKNDGKLAALSSSAIMNQSFMKNMFDNTATSKFGGLGAGSSDFSKAAAKKAKQYAFEMMIDETIDSAITFVKRMVREEIKAVSASFSSHLHSPIRNIDHLFLLSPAWIIGSVNGGGPIDVTSDPTKSSAYKIPSGMHSSVSSAIDELKSQSLPDFAEKFETAFGDMEEWPFVLEKYVRIIDQETIPVDVSEREKNLYGVVNMEDWKAYVQSKKSQGITGKISDLFGSYQLTGETALVNGHMHKYEVDDDGNGFAFKICHDEEEEDCHIHRIINWELREANGHQHVLPKPAWKFGLRLCYLPDSTDGEEAFSQVAHTISADAKMREKAYDLESNSGKRYLIPIASVEIDIPDQEFTSFNPDSYDVYCLIPPLVESPEYKAWFRYVFPLPRFLSLLTIYCMQGFYDSLANEGWPAEGGDMWEKRGGNWASGFSKWERSDEQVFEESRKAARNALNALYETTQAEYDSKEVSKQASLSFGELLKPVLNFEDGLRWWQRGKRLKKSPFDMDGDKCG